MPAWDRKQRWLSSERRHTWCAYFATASTTAGIDKTEHMALDHSNNTAEKKQPQDSIQHNSNFIMLLISSFIYLFIKAKIPTMYQTIFNHAVLPLLCKSRMHYCQLGYFGVISENKRILIEIWLNFIFVGLRINKGIKNRLFTEYKRCFVFYSKGQ